MTKNEYIASIMLEAVELLKEDTQYSKTRKYQNDPKKSELYYKGKEAVKNKPKWEDTNDKYEWGGAPPISKKKYDTIKKGIAYLKKYANSDDPKDKKKYDVARKALTHSVGLKRGQDDAIIAVSHDKNNNKYYSRGVSYDKGSHGKEVELDQSKKYYHSSPSKFSELKGTRHSKSDDFDYSDDDFSTHSARFYSTKRMYVTDKPNNMYGDKCYELKNVPKKGYKVDRFGNGAYMIESDKPIPVKPHKAIKEAIDLLYDKAILCEDADEAEGYVQKAEELQKAIDDIPEETPVKQDDYETSAVGGDDEKPDLEEIKDLCDGDEEVVKLLTDDEDKSVTVDSDGDALNEGALGKVLASIVGTITLCGLYYKMKTFIIKNKNNKKMTSLYDHYKFNRYSRMIDDLVDIIDKVKFISYKKSVKDVLNRNYNIIQKAYDQVNKIDKELFSIKNQDEFLNKIQTFRSKYSNIYKSTVDALNKSNEVLKSDDEYLEDDSIKPILKKYLNEFSKCRNITTDYDDFWEGSDMLYELARDDENEELFNSLCNKMYTTITQFNDDGFVGNINGSVEPLKYIKIQLKGNKRNEG